MNKRKFHHYYSKLRDFDTKWLVLAFIISFTVCTYSLRQNNIKAIHLRDDVLLADKQNKDVESALRKLRGHVYSHMNTNLSSGTTSIQHPVQLKYTYERLTQAEKDRVSKINEKIYADAQSICEQKYPVGLSGRNRIPCIEAYVAENGAKEQPIQDSLYKYNFVSPGWSADLAGISMVISVVLLILITVKLTLNYWLKSQFKQHL
ncbi:MAG: hypothetical protein U0451_03525 [Candidatus Saccharimonadales bacterium]